MDVKGLAKRILPPTTRMVDRRVELLQTQNAMLAEQLSHLTEEVRLMRGELAQTRSQVLALRARALEETVSSSASSPLEDLGRGGVVVSVASYGRRIATIAPMLESLGNQSVRADHVLLWLPAGDFPNGVRDLPSEVVCALVDAQVELRWVEDDLGPHNKYYWAMQAFPESTLITLDDDARYPSDLVERLLDAHKKWPRAVVGMRTNLISFDGDKIRPYADWEIEQTGLIATPSPALLATGFGGVLYPSHCVDDHVFDRDAIRRTSLYADDLWLKVMEVAAGTDVVCPSDDWAPNYIEGTQEDALCRANLDKGGNDPQLAAILSYAATFCSVEDLLSRMRVGVV